ncbi:DDE-type integrase/transposase/recombinase [Sphingomonas sp. RRHST34]|uniref:DDE-type integrase/transposase/recombinase n=1 Tax=Sphingomonas citri TaxID=2862499 RepID=A0ABS7BSF1_9SPHN|nr:DDE-type integrase/transposase/recombinase [Sphingomonas citri]MBW6532508.1 DDE-type integrase/transposase/recombinase [Sphingomonas citri]
MALHLDDMYVPLNGNLAYLWRVVDDEGEVLESYVTRTRDKKSALALMKKAFKRHGSPKAITTEGLRFYGAALIGLGSREKQRVRRWARRNVNERLLSSRADKAVNVRV